ncbi:DoxX family protein [Jannaschia sp. 2305UL9-9]|uniref:DoxX family protein n=1 Tax=Jannaschia sp. 2305UL9-9 TaxID=3121638 RepID=UPI003528CFED
MIDIKTAPYAALILRVAMGVMFIAHGLLKLLVFTPAGTAGYFVSLGLPEWLAYAVIAAELAGGLLLIAGIGVRVVSLALVPILAGASVLAHGGNGWMFANEGGGWEFPVFWGVALVVQAGLGAGVFAVPLPKATATPRAVAAE